jgi:Fe-S-cluster containining protein
MFNESNDQETIDDLFTKTEDLVPKHGIFAIRLILKKIEKVTNKLDLETILSYLKKLLEISIQTNNIETEVAISIAIDGMQNNNEYRSRLNKYIDLSEIEPYFSDNPASGFNFNLILAAIFKETGSTRDALNYYEEALFSARKYQEFNQELYAFKCLGNILNEDGKYESASSFYQMVFYNRNRKLDFTCQGTGSCCVDFQVNITAMDILKIMKNEPELDIKDFVSFPGNEALESFVGAKEGMFENYHKELYYLKKKPENKECVFLIDKRCSIQSYKPLTCKNFPMELNDDRLTFSHNKFLKEVCGYCITPDKSNKEETIKNNIREQNYRFNFQRIFTNKIKRDYTYKKIDSDELLYDLLEITEKTEEMINSLKDIICSFPEVVKIIISFNKLEIEGQVPLIVYSEGDPEDIYEELGSTFREMQLPSVNKLKIADIDLLKIDIDADYSFIIVIRPVSELNSQPEIDEFTLYEKENYHVPEIKPKISIPQDEEAYAEVLKAVRTVTKAELQRNNQEGAKSALEKLVYLYKHTDVEESELIYLILDEIFYLHKLFFQRLKKTVDFAEYKKELMEFENKLINDDFMPDDFFNQLIFDFGKSLVINGLPQKANYYFNYLLDRINDPEIKKEYKVEISNITLDI